MPKYVFVCNKCTKTISKYASVETEKLLCSECDGSMIRQLPNISGQEVRETVDSVTGVTWHQDQKEKQQARKEEYFWEVEVPRLVEKYSVETCLENGWLTYNEKGELVIGKAPSKR